MYVDPETFSDLEIGPTPAARAVTVWSLLDRTRTRVGRDALRQRVTTSARSASDILDRQQSHQAIASSAGAYRASLDRADPDGVERYLNLNWQLPASMTGVIWYRRWYGEYLQDVAAGQRRIRGMLAAATDLRQRLASTDSVALHGIGDQIALVLKSPEISDLIRLADRESSADRRGFDQLARDRARGLITDLLNCLGAVEAMWSLAAVTLEHGWIYPRPGLRLAVDGLFHPFLGPHAVRNDLDIAQPVRVCFVTGPNMAGKSTFLKAVAVAIFLAHIGCGVPATAMEFPVIGTLFSSIDIADDLNAGESFYLAEVRRMRALAIALSKHGPGVAMIDEPFRGTNVHDAAEATLATVTRLAALPAGLVFVASHLGVVVPAISVDPRIRFIHFTADMTGDQPCFDYRLRAGVSEQRLGMILLKQEQVLELLDGLAQAEPDPSVHGAG
jgi:DNA mismatch repair ATPase MutS